MHTVVHTKIYNLSTHDLMADNVVKGIDRYDGLGTLLKADISVDFSAEIRWQMENTHPVNTLNLDYEMKFHSEVFLSMGTGGLNLSLPLGVNELSLFIGRGLGPYDGVSDFAGTSGGFTSTTRSSQMVSSFTLESNPDKIAALVGSGLVEFDVSSPMTTMTGPGTGMMGGRFLPTAVVTVQYHALEILN